MENVKITVRVVLLILFTILVFSYLIKQPIKYDDDNTDTVTAVCVGYHEEEYTVLNKFATTRIITILKLDNNFEYLISDRERKYVIELENECLHQNVTIQFEKKSHRIVTLICNNKTYFSADSIILSNIKDWILLSVLYVLVLIFVGTITYWQIQDKLKEKKQRQEKQKRKEMKRQRCQEILSQKQSNNSNGSAL